MALLKLGVNSPLKPPRSEMMDLGLTTLQSIYRQLISSGALGRARPITPTGDYTARENDRIYRNSNTVGNISLPETVRDDCSNGYHDCDFYDYPAHSGPRTPRDGCFVIINDAISGNSVEYIYEAYINQWVSVHDLSLQQYQEITDPLGNIVEILQASTAPLSNRDANGLAALLATKMCDYFGKPLNPTTIVDAKNFEADLVSGFGEPERRIPNHLFEDWGRLD